MGMNALELRLEMAINEAGEFKDVRLSKEDAEKILEMMKEQEPVVPQKHYNKNADLLYACGKCHNDLKPNNRNAKFCWFCGQEVKWK